MSNYITRAEVHAAADHVDANGKKPTSTSVRAITGRGSNSTIDAHLLSWVPRDQRLELPPVPDGLTCSVSALTLDLWHMARTFASEALAAQIAQATADTAEAQATAGVVGDRADR
ncbi:MAG: DNA-binding protein, partial [Bradyrhizobium sp.]